MGAPRRCTQDLALHCKVGERAERAHAPASQTRVAAPIERRAEHRQHKCGGLPDSPLSWPALHAVRYGGGRMRQAAALALLSLTTDCCRLPPPHARAAAGASGLPASGLPALNSSSCAPSCCTATPAARFGAGSEGRAHQTSPCLPSQRPLDRTGHWRHGAPCQPQELPRAPSPQCWSPQTQAC
jgi:hypothetical protein